MTSVAGKSFRNTRIFSLFDYESESALWDCVFFGKCGLLLWLARAQHDHYESRCERNKSESEYTSPDFICNHFFACTMLWVFLPKNPARKGFRVKSWVLV